MSTEASTSRQQRFKPSPTLQRTLAIRVNLNMSTEQGQTDASISGRQHFEPSPALQDSPPMLQDSLPALQDSPPALQDSPPTLQDSPPAFQGGLALRDHLSMSTEQGQADVSTSRQQPADGWHGFESLPTFPAALNSQFRIQSLRDLLEEGCPALGPIMGPFMEPVRLRCSENIRAVIQYYENGGRPPLPGETFWFINGKFVDQRPTFSPKVAIWEESGDPAHQYKQDRLAAP